MVYIEGLSQRIREIYRLASAVLAVVFYRGLYVSRKWKPRESWGGSWRGAYTALSYSSRPILVMCGKLVRDYHTSVSFPIWLKLAIQRGISARTPAIPTNHLLDVYRFSFLLSSLLKHRFTCYRSNNWSHVSQLNSVGRLERSLHFKSDRRGQRRYHVEHDCGSGIVGARSAAGSLVDYGRRNNTRAILL